jgi:hypothetical protein
MSTIINATTTNGVVIQPDNSGSLVLQTNSGTTALTIDTSQRAAFVAGTEAAPAITTSGDTNTGIFFPAADTIAFAEGGAEAMRINSSGNVGIGAVPAYKLDVRNTGAVSNITCYFANTSTNNDVVNMFSVIPSQSFNTNSAHFAGQTAGTNTWLLYGNGTTSYVSDKNLKKNIQTTRNGYLDDVAQLRVVKYQWKINSDDSPLELGLIAQEVEQVFPNLVQEEKILLEDGTYGNPHKVIKGSVFQPILIKCVQELNEKIQEQQTIINDLKARIETLEAK